MVEANLRTMATADAIAILLRSKEAPCRQSQRTEVGIGFGRFARRRDDMTIKMNTLSRLLAAVGMTAVLAVAAAAPASAAKNTRAQARAYDTSAYARYDLPRSVRRQGPTAGYFAHGAVDDPPGSAFQSWGNDTEMGLVR
jgi:hypothetical protein